MAHKALLRHFHHHQKYSFSAQKIQNQSIKSQFPSSVQPLLINWYLAFLLKGASDAGILDAIPKNDPISIDDICDQCKTTHNTTLKTLRFMSSMGYTKEISDGTFIHTEQSLSICIGGNAHFTFYNFLDSDLMRGKINFSQYLKGASFKDLNDESSILDLLNNDNSKRQNLSGTMMEQQMAASEPEFLQKHHFDFSNYSKVLDLGGGIGELMFHIVSSYEHINGAVFEQEKNVNIAKHHWMNAHNIDMDKMNNMHFVVGDLFNEEDIMTHCSDCDVIILKRVIHDFEDAECGKILDNIKKAMGNDKNKILLICDLVLSDELNDMSDVGAKMLDLEFGYLLNWKERRLSQFDKLFEEHGFVRVESYPRSLGNIHVIAFKVKQDLTDPNICLQGLFSLDCGAQCCNVQNETCAPINRANNINPVSMPNEMLHTDAMYHQEQCIYEMANNLYDLYNLQINPYQDHSYNFTYQSTDESGTQFHNKSISLFVNICNISSVRNTQWNNPPNTLSLRPFLNSSIVVCAEWGSEQNASALCTQFGSVNYQTSDFTMNGNMETMINLGESTCLYYENPDVQIKKSVSTHLYIECDPDINKTEIYLVEGPVLSLDSSPENSKCSTDISIKMRTNKGACPRRKINATNSRIYCPQLFNQTTKIINCSLYTLTNKNQRIGDLNDIRNYYLDVFTVFGTQKQSILVEAGVGIYCNETGVFNISLDIRKIADWYDLTDDVKLWKNITIYASTNYSLGPNATTPNETILFAVVPDPPQDAPSDSYVAGWIIGTVFAFFLFLMVFRMQNEEARKFCCLYCLRCDCLSYGCNACMIGTYITCCMYDKDKEITIDKIMTNENEKKPNDKHERPPNNTPATKSAQSMTLISFLRYKWSTSEMNGTIDENNEVSASYVSNSEFLYRQKSAYAENAGILPLNSNSSKRKDRTKSISSEDYLI